MNTQSSKKHPIEMIIPLLLFCLFAISAILVIVFGAKIYERGVQTQTENFSARTAGAYIEEKIRHNDTAGAVSISELEGREALLLTHESQSGTLTSTYLYLYDNALRELTVLEGGNASAAAGTEILELRNFSVEKVKDSLLRVTCTDDDGISTTQLISLQSS